METATDTHARARTHAHSYPHIHLHLHLHISICIPIHNQIRIYIDTYRHVHTYHRSSYKADDASPVTPQVSQAGGVREG